MFPTGPPLSLPYNIRVKDYQRGALMGYFIFTWAVWLCWVLRECALGGFVGYVFPEVKREWLMPAWNVAASPCCITLYYTPQQGHAGVPQGHNSTFYSTFGRYICELTHSNSCFYVEDVCWMTMKWMVMAEVSDLWLHPHA